jgi:serine protease Do
MSRWSIATGCLALVGAAGFYWGANTLQGQAPSAPVFPKEMSSYREVVKRVLPAVVSIESKPAMPAKKAAPSKGQPARPRMQLPPGVPDEFRRFFEDGMPGMMDGEFEMPPMRASGSGFIVDAKGVVVTNYHVVDGAGSVQITLTDGRTFTSKEIKGDKKNDLAIIRFDPKGTLPALQFGDSDGMEIGDRVLAVGAPFGLAGSVSQGIVSAKGRGGLDSTRTVYEDYLQTDAAINPGNSGGPLVNLEGRVIGINTAIKSRNGGFQGVGLAITSNLAKNVVDQLQKDGIVHRGYMGISVRPVKPEVAALLGMPELRGLEVVKVHDSSPAAKAGMEDGDIIKSVAGHAVADARELQRVVGTLPLHQPCPVALVRDGREKSLQVTIEQQPEDYGVVKTIPVGSRKRAELEPKTVDKMGMEIADMDAAAASQFGYPEGKTGVVVSKVDPNGPAYDADIRAGMLLTKIDEKPVTNAAKALESLRNASADKGLLLQLETPPTPNGGGGRIRVAIKAETADK